MNSTKPSTPIVISNVLRHEQHGDAIYTFVLTGKEIIEMGTVVRFGADPNGVNRKLDDRHAEDIAEAMLDPAIVWLEPIQGDLSGRWLFEAQKLELTGEAGGAHLLIDNGQHRRRAMELLNDIELQKLSFMVTMTMNMPYDRRLRIFRMQRYQKRLDSRLDLAQRHTLGEWDTPLDAEAYDIVLQLNSDTTSPLKGTILLEEQSSRPYEGRHRPVGINGKGLHATIRSVIGTNSPLHTLSAEARKRTILHLIQLASTTWPEEWKSEKHVLTTARGINAVLGLIVSSPNFRGIIGEDFSQESLRKGLSHAASFSWRATDLRNSGVREIIGRLNQSIGRNRRAKLAPAKPGERAAAAG